MARFVKHFALRNFLVLVLAQIHLLFNASVEEILLWKSISNISLIRFLASSDTWAQSSAINFIFKKNIFFNFTFKFVFSFFHLFHDFFLTPSEKWRVPAKENIQNHPTRPYITFFVVIFVNDFWSNEVRLES